MDDNNTPLKTTPQQSSPSLNKESEPISTSSSEALEPIKEPEMNPEVAKFIEQKEKMTVPPDLSNMGVQTTDSNVAVANFSFPITDDKILEGLHQPINSSWRWLSEFLLYHLKQAHLTLKKVHGHIKRVVLR